MTNGQLRMYLDSEDKDSKDALTVEGLDELMQKKLKMNMDTRNVKSRIQSLFASYHSVRSQNGVMWIIDENRNMAVTHVLSEIRPRSLRQ